MAGAGNVTAVKGSATGAGDRAHCGGRFSLLCCRSFISDGEQAGRKGRGPPARLRRSACAAAGPRLAARIPSGGRFDRSRAGQGCALRFMSARATHTEMSAAGGPMVRVKVETLAGPSFGRRRWRRLDPIRASDEFWRSSLLPSSCQIPVLNALFPGDHLVGLANRCKKRTED